jgi:hypothetical protein
MTRGRPPRKALKEACDSAAQRGVVLEASDISRLHIDFILFVRHRVVFVRVKRSHSRVTSTEELRVQFSAEIAGLRKIPLTAVVSREVWVLLPWGTWQYFQIGDDSITEIRENNGRLRGTQENSAAVHDQQDPALAHAVVREGVSPGPVSYPRR